MDEMVAGLLMLFMTLAFDAFIVWVIAKYS